MIISIWGEPSSGKTTLFHLLTASGSYTSKGGDLVGVSRVPDPRVDFLSGMFKPKKTTYATIEFRDIPGYSADPKSGLKACDGIVLVLGAYDGGCVDFEAAYMEFVLSDLEQVERALARLNNGRTKPDRKSEVEFLEKMQGVLGEGRPAREAEETQEEARLLKNYGLLTRKPLVVAVNLSEKQLEKKDIVLKETIEVPTSAVGATVVGFAGSIEQDIAMLPPVEQQAFLAEYGLSEPGINRVSRAAYEASGLISFFTVGDDEVRAWPIKKGATAKEAAGRVHSDIERGFIRAEVFSFDDLRNLGSTRAIKEAGRLRLEAKDYVVKDGDICSFRFNV
jgi:GTP-binding protein YchF